MNNIVIGVDFSAVTKPLLKAAKALGLAQNARLVLVHAVAPEPSPARSLRVASPSEADEASKRLRLARRRLDAILNQMHRQRVDALALLFHGMPKDHLLREARTRKAQFLVVGSHGAGLHYRMTLGRTAMDVLSQAPCPVLIVPSPRPIDRNS
jgi:nucleotide-binding universal stress UspA family protein